MELKETAKENDQRNKEEIKQLKKKLQNAEKKDFDDK